LIRFYGGKPRAGKTKGAVLWMVEMVRTTHLPIVTNVAVRLHPWIDGKGVARPGLLEVLRRRYGTTFDIERRLYCLKHDEVRRFYGIRPIIPRDPDAPRETLIVPEQSDGTWKFDANVFPGCVQIIDEAHVYFPGAAVCHQKNMKVTPELLGWATQAGRCGDRCVFISQVLMNVDKQLRGVAQECEWYTNHRHARLGPFRQSDKITRKVYAQVPPGESETPLAKETVQYEREDIDGSYDTAAGVGVSGNSAADIGERAKGFPTYFIPVLIGVAAFAMLFFYWGIQKAVKVAFSLDGREKPVAVAGSSTNTFSAPTNPPPWLVALNARLGQLEVSKGHSEKSVASSVRRVERKTETNCVVAVSQGRAGFAVAFSDGVIINATSVRELGREYIVDGVSYPRSTDRLVPRVSSR